MHMVIPYLFCHIHNTVTCFGCTKCSKLYIQWIDRYIKRTDNPENHVVIGIQLMFLYFLFYRPCHNACDPSTSCVTLIIVYEQHSRQILLNIIACVYILYVRRSLYNHTSMIDHSRDWKSVISFDRWSLNKGEIQWEMHFLGYVRAMS